tara:strand:+ start:415 stop:1218 length:804 start_codon:yes stop_codon:yes gene_type:complete
MLGLGNTLIGGAPQSEFTPLSISGIATWLKFNTSITADQDNGGTTTYDPVRSVAAGTIADGDRINFWGDQSGNDNDAAQTTSADKPFWETDEEGSLHFKNNAKYMDLDEDISIAANADFTAVVRFKCENTSTRTLFGSTNEEFFTIANNKTFRMKINNGSNLDWAEASNTIATDTYYTLIIVRSNGSTGNINLYIKGGAYTTATGTEWDSSENITAPEGPIVINNLGSKADDSHNFRGFIKDFIIYNGTAVTSAERQALYEYIEAQT